MRKKQTKRSADNIGSTNFAKIFAAFKKDLRSSAASKIGEAYTAFRTELTTYAANKIDDVHAAEDLVQEVFIRYSAKCQVEDVADPRAMLFGILRNVIKEWLRQRKKRRDVSFPAVDAEWVERRETLYYAFKTILRGKPAEYLDAVLNGDFDPSKTADELSISVHYARRVHYWLVDEMKSYLKDMVDAFAISRVLAYQAYDFDQGIGREEIVRLCGHDRLRQSRYMLRKHFSGVGSTFRRGEVKKLKEIITQDSNLTKQLEHILLNAPHRVGSPEAMYALGESVRQFHEGNKTPPFHFD